MNEMKNSIEDGKFLSYIKINFEEMNTTYAEYGLLSHTSGSDYEISREMFVKESER